MNFLYRKEHMERFIKKSVDDNAIFFHDYSLYVAHNVDVLKNFLDSKNYARSEAVVLEFGVNQAKSINLLSTLLPECSCYGFDSFDSFKAVTHGEHWKSHDREFRNQKIPEVNRNVELIEGYVEDTFPRFQRNFNSEMRVVLIHLDVDIYEPTRVVLDWVREEYENLKFFIMFDEFINYKEFHINEYRAFLETICHDNIPFTVRSLCDRGANWSSLGKVFIEIGCSND